MIDFFSRMFFVLIGLGCILRMITGPDRESGLIYFLLGMVFYYGCWIHYPTETKKLSFWKFTCLWWLVLMNIDLLRWCVKKEQHTPPPQS